MKRYAIEHDVPIMPNESIEFVSKTLNENKAATILEIGAAIAFSASALVLDNPKRIIDTLERDKSRLFFAYTDIVCIIDNVNYHGFVDDSGFETIYSRSLRSMIKRIREFKEYLNSRTDLEVIVHDIGDGMMVIKRK